MLVVCCRYSVFGVVCICDLYCFNDVKRFCVLLFLKCVCCSVCSIVCVCVWFVWCSCVFVSCVDAFVCVVFSYCDVFGFFFCCCAL